MELVPDTLVLKIVENLKGITDTTLYAWYDKNIHRYVIRGKRNDAKEPSVAYSFECETAHGLVDFIAFVVNKESDISYVLYNYDNLSADSNNITYDFLETYDDPAYEISGYDKVKFTKKMLLRYLRILRNVFNYNN